MIEGTVSYMAPEQARGEAVLTSAVDVYGLGGILYEVLTGRPPFRGQTRQETLRQVCEDPVVPPRRLAPAVPADLEAICLKCLAKAPEDRYPGAAAVADDLRRFRDGRPVEARPLPWWGRLYRWVRRQPPLPTAAVVLLTVALFAVLGWQAALYVERRAEERWRFYLQGVHLADRIIAARLSAPAGGWHVASAALDRADETLLACPEDQRGWEWHYLRRISRRRQTWLRGHEGGVVSVRCSPPGGPARVLTGDDAGAARLWDPRTGTEVVPAMQGHRGPVQACFTSDGGRVVTAGIDQTVLVWDAATGKRLFPLPLAGDLAACDSKGRWLATVGRAEKTVRLHDQRTGRLEGQRAAPFAVVSFALSPDGRFLALGGFHTEVVLWEVPALRPVPVAPHGQHATVWALAFSPDGRHLAASLPEPVLFALPAEAGRRCEVVRTFGSPGSANPASLDFSPDGRLLAAPFRNGTVRVWDVSTGRTVRAPTRHDDVVFAAAFSPSGEALAVTRGRDVVIEELYAPGGAACRVLRGPADAGMTSLSFSPDGTWLAGRTAAGEVLAWDAASADLRWRAQAGPGEAALFHAGRLLADGGGRLHSWDPASGAADGWPAGADRLSCLAAAGRGPLVAGAAGDSRVFVWNVERRTGWEFASKTPQIQALAFHPDGQRLASGGADGTVHFQLLDDRGRQAGPPVALSGHSETVHSLAFSRDGRWLASGGADATIRLWAGTAPRGVIAAHGGAVSGLAFHPDGRRLASCGEDGAVKVWDVRTGAELVTLIDHGSPFRAIAFCPDGHRLAACSQDGTVRVWDGTPHLPSVRPQRSDPWPAPVPPSR